VKANANAIRAAIDAAKPDIRLFLLHGPDEAGAQELFERLARKMGPDAERIDLEPGTLRGDPGRLADEAASLSLFGGARYIRISGAGEECLNAATLLLDAETAGNPVVMIGPALRGTARLVKLAQGASRAMAYACYVPDAREAAEIASLLGRERGLRLSSNAAQSIAAATAGDRSLIARELEKLALYLDASPEQPRDADGEAYEAIGAALGETEMSRAIDAAIDGRADLLGRELARLEEEGISPIPLLRQLVKRLMALADMQAEIANGARAADLVERVFFRERAATSRALRAWRPAALVAAIDRARSAERGVMASGTAGNILAQSAMLAVARMAARQQ
jgi:DNA polymerase III subunit delta